MTMWLLGKSKDEKDDSNSSKGKSPSSSSSNKKNRKASRRRNRKGKNSPGDHRAKDAIVAETYTGIEVSLSNDNAPPVELSPVRTLSSTKSTETALTSVLSFREQILELKKVRTMDWTINESKDSPAVHSPRQVSFTKTRKHRLPLFQQNEPRRMNFEDALQLLTNQEAVDELALTKNELSKLDFELSEIQEDRNEIKQRVKEASEPQPSLFDKFGMLGGGNHKRSKLQVERGTSLTFYLNHKPRESLMSKCASKSSSLSPLRKKSPKHVNSILTLSTNNCREGGAATNIATIRLLKDNFFLYRDSGKSFLYDSKALPGRLSKRLNGRETELIDLVATSDSYYVEFRNGDAWWGTEDLDLDKMCQALAVDKIAFGPTTILDRVKCPSWILITKDGKVAWKNIPSRLQSLFSNGLKPVEVSLGPNGSYFCRFTNGTTDWQLPAKVAEVCEQLEQDGREITYISLHPEVSEEFIVRHR